MFFNAQAINIYYFLEKHQSGTVFHCHRHLEVDFMSRAEFSYFSVEIFLSKPFEENKGSELVKLLQVENKLRSAAPRVSQSNIHEIYNRLLSDE